MPMRGSKGHTTNATAPGLGATHHRSSQTRKGSAPGRRHSVGIDRGGARAWRPRTTAAGTTAGDAAALSQPIKSGRTSTLAGGRRASSPSTSHATRPQSPQSAGSASSPGQHPSAWTVPGSQHPHSTSRHRHHAHAAPPGAISAGRSRATRTQRGRTRDIPLLSSPGAGPSTSNLRSGPGWRSRARLPGRFPHCQGVAMHNGLCPMGARASSPPLSVARRYVELAGRPKAGLEARVPSPRTHRGGARKRKQRGSRRAPACVGTLPRERCRWIAARAWCQRFVVGFGGAPSPARVSQVASSWAIREWASGFGCSSTRRGGSPRQWWYVRE